ncbi:hypothetical protein [Nonomuraea sp. KM88]
MPLAQHLHQNEIEQRWRDVAVGSRHPQLNPYLGIERYGTALADAAEG